MSEQSLTIQEKNEECQPPRVYSQVQVLINNVPYAIMTALGGAIILSGFGQSIWGRVGAAAYVLYGIVGALWIMVFVCPFCHYWNTRACPCGYGQIAARLREKKDGDRFAEKFKKHIPVIVPLWIIPVVAGAFALYRDFSWPLLVLLVGFGVDAFGILPLLSRKHGCADCPQKETCPWMGGKTEASISS